jgi:hypothetical protein
MTNEDQEWMGGPEMLAANVTCAWCRASIVYSHDPAMVLCTNCTYYIKKQHPDLYRPSLRANLVRLRGLAHQRFCCLLLADADRQARAYLLPKDYAAFRVRHDERIAQHAARFAWLDESC